MRTRNKDNRLSWNKIILSIVLSAAAIPVMSGHTSPENAGYYKKPKAENEIRVMESRYDYSLLAESITRGCKNDYEKIRAIYLWLCDNIEYDTSFQIYHADDCYDKRKGVCNAYSELFYYLAKSIGIRSEIISGHTRDINGVYSNKGHAWNFAYINKDYGILLDATWGAGSVNDGQFRKSDNPLHWFNVDPRWMILRHFPKEDEYQLLDNPLSEDEFKNLPAIDEAYADYGLDVREAYEAAIAHSSCFPCFYCSETGKFKLLEYPRKNSLQIGEISEFRIKLLADVDFAIINGSYFVNGSEWTDEGDGIYSIKFIPREKGPVILAVKKCADKPWEPCVEYNSAGRNLPDGDNEGEPSPTSITGTQRKAGTVADIWKSVGLSEKLIRAALLENGDVDLPVINTGYGQEFTVDNIPLKKILLEGNTYEFSFYPKSGIKWVLINNDRWYYDWDKNTDGKYTMKVSPESGQLMLCVQIEEGVYFWPALVYIVN